MCRDYISILQITDCHLQEHQDKPLKGYYPDARLDQVVKSILEKQSTSQENLYDHLLLTGDLAQDVNTSVYHRVLEKTQGLATKRHWIPGNHDDTSLMQLFPELSSTVVIAGNWGVVLLDSTSNPNGVGSGSLSQSALKQLSETADLAIEHLLLVLHHPPVNVGSAWQDAIKLANSDEFWEVVDTLDNVKGVLFGHVHQEYYIKRDNVELFATPATAPQFKKGQETPVLEDDPELALPGYRELKLYPNGDIDTQVFRVNL